MVAPSQSTGIGRCGVRLCQCRVTVLGSLGLCALQWDTVGFAHQGESAGSLRWMDGGVWGPGLCADSW